MFSQFRLHITWDGWNGSLVGNVGNMNHRRAVRRPSSTAKKSLELVWLVRPTSDAKSGSGRV